MSAVFGVINFNNSSISKDIEQEMINKLGIYKLDAIKSLNRNNNLLGCGIQYITPESMHEVLPYYDEHSGLTITADAIIDNRLELFSLLAVSMDFRKDITDSELILMAYKKWGIDCSKYLVGDFAFVIWDERKQELYCARDHVGKRTFYYYYKDNVFAFCTVIKPLFSVINTKMELNERWIADYLAVDGLVHEIECYDTIYKDIYQLMPANHIYLSKNGLKINKYWDPVKEIIPLKLKSDEQYEEAFKKVFFEAVNCRLRSTGETGIMVSGGLDSSSVACTAARTLCKEGKNLKAFASVPILEYKNNVSKYYIPDETEYIESIKEKADNIDITYFRCEGKHPLSDLEYFIDILEQPYKIYRTLYWVNDIAEKASENGCRVLLNGQFGNSTISYGNFITHALTLYRKGKVLTLLKEISAMSKLTRKKPYFIGKVVAKSALPYQLRSLIDKARNKNYDRFLNTPITKSLIDKWNLNERLNKKNINQLTQRFYDLKEDHEQIVSTMAFSHISAIETKLSLAHGIVLRDPTRDKRVIEFCLRLPTEQYVRNGQERYLIRRAMKGILPDKIRTNLSRRGLQSADWLQRLEPKWENIYGELEKIIDDENIHKYIDCSKLRERLEKLKPPLDGKKESDILMFLTTLVFHKFIKINDA